MAANTDPPAASYPGLSQDGNRQPPSVELLPSSDDASAQVNLAATISRLRDEASQHAASASSARESVERLRLAIAASGVGIWDLDPISRELSWSDHCYELFGLAVGTEVTYDTFLAGIHPEDRAVADADVQQALDPIGDGRYARTFRVVGIET